MRKIDKEKEARQKLTALLNSNFKDGDVIVQLTYRADPSMSKIGNSLKTG